MPINLSGSLILTGSLTVTGGITMSGSIASASYALNTSFLNNSGSGEFVPTGSFNTFSSSILTYTGSANSRLSSIESRTGSYATTGSNTFIDGQYLSSSFNPTGFSTTASLYTDGGLRVTRDAYISGTLYLNNVTVYGTQSVCFITSSQLNIGSNIISVNTSTPSVRFGGLSVYDSGSTGLTGSILWDSQDNQWIYSNPSGSAYDSAMFLVGPRSTGALGSEVGIECNFLSKGNGLHHMTSSAIFENGSRTCFYGTTVVGSGGTVCTAMGNFACVGIGTMTPANAFNVSNNGASGFEVSPTGGVNSGVLLQAYNRSTSAYMAQSYYACAHTFNVGTSGGTRALDITAGGSVGIGTTSPDIFGRGDGFDVGISSAGVGSTQNMSLQLNAGATAGRGAQLYMGQGGTRHFTISSNATESTIGTTSNTPLRFVTCDSLERMRITATGVVGIGSNAPVIDDGNLVVAGCVGTGQGTANTVAQINIWEITSGNKSGLWFGSMTNANTGVIGSRTATGNIAFQTYCGAWAERMRITYNGRVGIGTTTPCSALEVFSRAADADRTIPHNILTLTAEQGNAPYGFFGGAILFKNRSYTSGLVESSRIRSVIYDDGAPNNCGGGLWFETTRTPGGALTPSLRIDYQGKVGIGDFGIFGPVSDLELRNSNAIIYDPTSDSGQDGSGVTLTIRNNDTSCVGSFSQVNMQVSGDAGRALGRIVTIRMGSATSDMAFVTENENTKAEKMRITAAGSVGIGTTNMSAEGNLFLGAKSTIEGGQLVLQRGTSCNCATHLDNFSNRFRIMSGTDTASVAELFSISMINGSVNANAANISTSAICTSATTAISTSRGIVIDANTTTNSAFVPIGFSWASSISTFNPTWGMALRTVSYNAGTADLVFYTSGDNVRMTISNGGSVSVAGALSKGSGSFRICHPLASKKCTHQLVHSFIEGPQADLIYRGKINLANGIACINIDCAARMTEGTFEALNRCVQVFTTNESSWDAVRGKVQGNTLVIESQNNTSTDEISWMVIGERQDEHMFETDWTDQEGKVITEPEII